MRHAHILDSIGHTPLVRLAVGSDAVETYAKLELQNMFAMKDRVALRILLEAKRRGELADKAPIVESSSGTMALGLTWVARRLDHEVHIVTDPRIDAITLAKLNALGAHVHIVQAMTGQGWQSARLERLAQLQRELPGAYWPRQYSNPANPAAYEPLAAELMEDLDRIDVLVGTVGSGGSLCGTARALRQHCPDLRIVAVDCVGSVLFGQPDKPARLQSGLGSSLHPANLDRGLVDEVHWLNDREAFASTCELAREQGIFAGNTSGSVYRVLKHVAAHATTGSRIVGIFPDRGDRYADTVYNERFWEAQGIHDEQDAARPVKVSYGTEVSAWSYAVPPPGPPPRPSLLFVESNTTGTGMLALQRATELEFQPILATGDRERYRGLDAARVRTIICNTNAVDDLRILVESQLNVAELAGVTTTSEFYLDAVAQLACSWGLRGTPPEVARRCRDKSAVREALDSAGIGQPDYALVRTAAQAREAVERVGLPCVVKPVDESGSQHVRRCSSVDRAVVHAMAIANTSFNVRGQPAAGVALIEQYVDGEEFSVEMLSVDGPPACVGITAKEVTDPPFFVETGHVFPAPLPAPVASRVEGTVRRALAAIGSPMGPTHTEVRITSDRVYVIEVNARLAGGMIPELVRLSTGIDLLTALLNCVVGAKVDLRSRDSRCAGIRFLTAPEDGTLVDVAGTSAANAVPGVESVVVTAPAGARVRRPRSAYDRLGYVIASATTHARLRQVMAAAMAELRVDIQPSGELQGTPR